MMTEAELNKAIAESEARLAEVNRFSSNDFEVGQEVVVMCGGDPMIHKNGSARGIILKKGRKFTQIESVGPNVKVDFNDPDRMITIVPIAEAKAMYRKSLVGLGRDSL